MSKEEKLQEIKDIFLYLTEQEPTPDDEIEARNKLIEKFNILKYEHLFPSKEKLIEDILDKLEKWDTLDLWFKEVDGLPENIEKILNLSEKKVAIPQAKEEIAEEKKSKPETTQIDISKIVAEVSEQFRGEISSLKEQIEQLQKELDKKELTIKEVPQKSDAEGSTLKKDIKLAPPKIKIPLIKKPQKPPKIKFDLEAQLEAIKESVKTEGKKFEPIPNREELETPELILNVNETQEIPPEAPKETQIDQKLLEQSKIPPEAPSESDIMLDTLKKAEIAPEAPKGPELKPKALEEPNITPEAPEKSEIRLEIPEIPKLKPIISEEPSKENLSEIPFRPLREKLIEKGLDFEKTDLKPFPAEEELEVNEKNPVKLELKPFPPAKLDLPIEIEETLKSIPSSTDNSKIIVESEEEQEFTPLPIKGISEFTPVISKKPQITPISIEEIDTESIKSTGKELFNVFSSLGSKPKEQSVQPIEEIEIATSKSKKKKSEKKKKRIESLKKVETPTLSNSIPFIPEPEISIPEPENGVDTLPKDKDSLYQELIALEGKRYALEKSYKDLDRNYQLGIVDELEYHNQSSDLKSKLDEISSRINNIRRIISSM
ncbi:MAG: hypothetical protein ACFFAN_04605 [Promethearchaeota archaeon]